MKEWTEVFKKHRVRLGEGGWSRRAVDAEDRYLWTSKLKSGGRWLKTWEIRHRRRQTDHVPCVATGRMFTLCIAMRAKNYSERQNWRHQFRGQHERNKARSKRVVVAVGNCTRAMCVRARRCQSSSTESARCPPQRLYIPGQFVRWNTRVSYEWFLLRSMLNRDGVILFVSFDYSLEMNRLF